MNFATSPQEAHTKVCCMKSGSMGKGSIMLMVIVRAHLLQGVVASVFFGAMWSSVVIKGTRSTPLSSIGDFGGTNMRAGLPVSQIGASQSGGHSWFSWFANRTAQLSGKPA